jgi:glycerol uptake facilitator-like aquaporin
VFALALLILVIGPISGAHLNPAVTLVNAFSRQQPARESALYIAAQTAGAIGGAILANVMFDYAAVQISERDRTSPGMLVGEVVATAGLIAIIGILSARKQNAIIPVAVAGWIGSAYFFTSSTSFANPAVTVGRMFTDTFAGIAPTSVLPYIAAQLVGAIIGAVVVKAASRTA